MPTTEHREFFHEASLALASSLQLELVLKRLTRCMAGVMPVKRILVTRIERDLDAIRVLATATPQEGRLLDLVLPLAPGRGREFEKQVWASGRRPPVLLIDDPRDDILGLSERELADRLPFVITIPRMSQVLALGGRRVGGIVLLPRDGERFDEDHAQLLSLVNEPCALAVSNALQHMELVRIKESLREENRRLYRELHGYDAHGIIGAELGLRDVMDLVRKVAPQEATVLILGETGVGKEVVATTVHALSSRREGPLVRVNCGALPETLIDSELFGHEKGAFTGASTSKAGRFERASGGTIFLDEVGELPPATQTRLLRVLQTGEIERVGGNRPIQLDLRVIAATNRDMEAMVAQGRFRRDLLFRLDVFPIRVPPLRERREDIGALVDHFVAEKARQHRLADVPRLAPGAMEALYAYPWPGNVRELMNVVERAMILAPEGPLEFDWLLRRASAPPGSTHDAGELQLDAVIAAHIRAVLRTTGGKIAGPGGAAELMGLHPNTLRSRMKRLGIDLRGDDG